MIQSIRVRAWQNGKLVGEFAEKGGKAAEVEWPLNPPAVPAGAEAGSGPWLQLDKTRADFSGISLGASAAEVLQTGRLRCHLRQRHQAGSSSSQRSRCPAAPTHRLPMTLPRALETDH